MLYFLSFLGFLLLLGFAAFGALVLYWIWRGGKDMPNVDQTASMANGLTHLHTWLRHRSKCAAAVILYMPDGKPYTPIHKQQMVVGDITVRAFRAFNFNSKDLMENMGFRPDDKRVT